MSKPYKGTISQWHKHYPDSYPGESLGFLILGLFDNHPQFAGRCGHTSMVVKADMVRNTETGETRQMIETLNSLYILIGPEQQKPGEAIPEAVLTI